MKSRSRCRNMGEATRNCSPDWRRRGGRRRRVPVYQWALPEDTAPLAEALEMLLAGQFKVVIFTTSVQIEHLLEFAEQQGKRAEVLDALQKTFIASIGPTCSESLRARRG